MGVDWELVRSGPDGAEHGVLLLPGGANGARAYSEVMAQPVLAGTRLVAATLPGNVGTPPPTDFSIENYARLAAELAADNDCDVVAGFSMGASVALEMAASGAFKGPLVLLGVSLSDRDEPAFFRAIVRLGDVMGGLPSAMLMRLTAIAVRSARVSDEHRDQMRADFRSNDPRVLRSGLRAYLEYLGQTRVARRPSLRRRSADVGRPCRKGRRWTDQRRAPIARSLPAYKPDHDSGHPLLPPRRGTRASGRDHRRGGRPDGVTCRLPTTNPPHGATANVTRQPTLVDPQPLDAAAGRVAHCTRPGTGGRLGSCGDHTPATAQTSGFTNRRPR